MNSLGLLARAPNRTGSNRDFDAATVAAVWLKGRAVAGHDSSQVRMDRCGAWMRFDAYGDTDSNYGWEIDHDIPVAAGGGDNLANLQPLYWRNNRHKGDSWPSWSCGYSAST